MQKKLARNNKEHGLHCHLLKCPCIFFGIVAFLIFLGAYGCGKEEKAEVPKAKTIVRMKIHEMKVKTHPSKAMMKKKEQKGPVALSKVASASKKPTPPVAPAKGGAGIVTSGRGAEKAGHYKVKKGDSLASIAAQEGVYGDPLKWPSLYRLNMGRLKKMGISEDLDKRALPEGIELGFVTPGQARENTKRLSGKHWVVNVFSSPEISKIVPLAVKLMQSGYHVYITKAKVKGKEWIRLRAGFFKNRREASAAGKKMMSLLKINGAWVAKIGKEERKRFAGY